jgi:hypothetical protein
VRLVPQRPDRVHDLQQGQRGGDAAGPEPAAEAAARGAAAGLPAPEVRMQCTQTHACMFDVVLARCHMPLSKPAAAQC